MGYIFLRLALSLCLSNLLLFTQPWVLLRLRFTLLLAVQLSLKATEQDRPPPCRGGTLKPRAGGRMGLQRLLYRSAIIKGPIFAQVADSRRLTYRLTETHGDSRKSTKHCVYQQKYHPTRGENQRLTERLTETRVETHGDSRRETYRRFLTRLIYRSLELGTSSFERPPPGLRERDEWSIGCL